MQQLRTVWANLDRKRQVTLVVAVLAVFLGVIGLSRIAASPNMQLLYAGLESGSAGEVVRSLEQQGVPYEVRGGSIYVPASRRDELRLTLASEGLPANGGRGYELLDSLSGFGTTSQMFDAAYWRAKEGELARTIVASPHIAQARVHISSGSANPFQRTIEPTASVSVVASGAQITPAQANAVRFLVASAVSGLTVENVTVIDSNGGVIGTQEAAGASTAEDRVQQMRERVLRLVEARVGRGNAIVEVSIDTVTETESIRERRFDPNGRVAISTDVEERADTSKNLSSEVTVASNLPDGDGATGDESNSSASSTRERVNYEVSETETEIHRGPGAIRRLTVAVLVNGLQATGENGEVQFAPRPEDELNALRELVKSAVGFDKSRGDVITLKSMDLPDLEPQGTAAGVPVFRLLPLDLMSLVQLATLALVTLVLALFVVRPILTRPAAAPNLLSSPRRPDREIPDLSALTGEIQMARTATERIGGPAAGENGGALPALSGAPGVAAVDRLRAMIGDKQEETVEILRSWLEENNEEKA